MKHSLLGLSLAVIVAIAPSLSAAPPPDESICCE